MGERGKERTHCKAENEPRFPRSHASLQVWRKEQTGVSCLRTGALSSSSSTEKPERFCPLRAISSLYLQPVSPP